MLQLLPCPYPQHRYALRRSSGSAALWVFLLGGPGETPETVETIGGRLYHIEVSAIASNRWRAQIVRAPGVPTAMMPFYGTTPDAAAGQLSAWLALAYRTAAPPVSP